MNEEIIFLGILFSIIFYETTNISPGGVIVPGYFALFLNNPQRVVLTIVVAILSCLTVKLLSNHVIVFGRRKFVLFILMAFVFKYFFRGMNFEIFGSGLVIGILIPGILAADMERNGMIKTLGALTVVTLGIKAAMNIMFRFGFLGL